ncbi:MAG TPA: hypothetical protein VF211_04335 [Burkholderiales bacterium]
MTPDPMRGDNPAYRDDIRDFQEDADAALRSAKEQLTEVLDGISERAREYGRYADEQVQANPWAAVGVGFGIGVAMGVLLAIAARR